MLDERRKSNPQRTNFLGPLDFGGGSRIFRSFFQHPLRAAAVPARSVQDSGALDIKISTPGRLGRRAVYRRVSIQTARRRIAIAAGGTAGHVYPAWAVAEAYSRMSEPVEVVFFAPEENAEQRLLKDRGYLLHKLQASPLVGVPWPRKVLNLAGLSRSIVRARSILKDAGVEVVLGFGGYASVALVTAAWSLGLRTAIFESNWSAGVANRVLGRLVDRVYLMHGSAQSDFPAQRCLVIGSPVRPDVALLAGEQRRLPLGAGPVRVLVTGGSLGSAFLNHRVPELLSLLRRDGIEIEVYHQTGRGDAEAVRERYSREGISARTASYIEDIAPAYQWADFAIACAGAATLSELATAGIPALLVPSLSAARNHQLPNARVFAATTECLWATEGDWDTEALSRTIARIVRSPQEWQAAARRMRHAATPSAVDALVDDWRGFLGRGARN